MNNSTPRNTRELYFYTKGEFETINEKLEGIATKLKLVFWIGGFAGTVFSAIVIGILKIAKIIK